MFRLNRLDIIKEFEELHLFILNFFNDLDKESWNLLKEMKFCNNVVKKTIDLGVCYPTNKKYTTLYYSFAYTFFEDLEDKYGGRDNDVVLLLSIKFYENKSFILAREIGTFKDDIEYADSNELFVFNNRLKDEIYSMKLDFLNYLKEIAQI